MSAGCGGDDPSEPRTLTGTGGTATGGAGSGGVVTGGANTGGAVTGGALTTGGVAGTPTGGVAGTLTGGTAGSVTGGVGGLGGATGGETASGGTTGGTAGTGGGITGGTAGTGGDGTGGSTGLTLIGDIDRGGGLFVLEMDGTYFAVSTTGGRIVAFGPSSAVNLLPASGINAGDANIYGSTLWTSPQSDWSWPPLATMDSAAYTGSVTGNVITMTSTQNTTVGSASLQVTKTFEPDLTDGSIVITYTLTNLAAASVSVAPWEVTRFYPDGLTVFPKGSVTGATDLPHSDPGDGYIWYDQSLDSGTGEKLFGDSGDGWMAHVDRRSTAAGDATTDYLVVLQWEDVPITAQAPAEGEVEIYNGSTYIEAEVQGPYGPVAGGGSVSFTERWTVLPLATANPAVGSTEVIAAVTSALR